MPILTPLITHTPNAQPLFATVSATGGSSGGTERAEAFIARNATPGVAGFVAACGDGSGATDAELFEMRTGGVVENTLQWTMGMSSTPAGANAGNDFAITAYDDNGASLGTPFRIERSTGGIAVGELGGTGGRLDILGNLGASRVNDPVYNPVVTYGAEVTLGAASRTGVIVSSFPYTAPKTGVYCLTVSVNVDANGLVWTNGATGVIGYATFSGGGGGTASNSYLACDSIMVPNGTIPGLGPNVYIKDMVAFIELDKDDVIVPSIYTQGGMNLGATGAVT
jgi:hypothetical protein